MKIKRGETMNLKGKSMKVNIQFFADAADANTTQQASMSAQMKAFYDTELLENSRKDMFFSQFGEKQPLPAGGGNKVVWRKWNTFDKAMTPLTEGVTPTGQTFGSTKIEAECFQHGTYTKITDKLELQAIDDVILGAAEEMGASAGETQDTLIRNRVISGTNVYYAPNGNTPVTSRKDITKACVLTPTLVNKVATKLKKAKAPKIDGSYIMLIHPSCSFDIRESDGWKDVHKYAAVKEVFNGEIGELHGVRFIENDNVKVIAPGVISDSLNKLTVKTAVTSAAKSISVNEKLTAASNLSIPVYIAGKPNTITAIADSGENSTITLENDTTAAAGDLICGQGAGKDGSAVYCNIAMGAKAYGIVDPEGAGLEMIIHDKNSGGTENPLNLYSTIGYKFMYGCRILYPERLVRVECGSEFSEVDEEN